MSEQQGIMGPSALGVRSPGSGVGGTGPVPLSRPMLDLLWDVAQMKYGWAHVQRYGGQMQVADALVRRGLVEWGRNGRNHPDPRIVATEAGRTEIERRWPVSPYVLGTYEHQPNGWDPVEGRRPSSPTLDLARERLSAQRHNPPKTSDVPDSPRDVAAHEGANRT